MADFQLVESSGKCKRCGCGVGEGRGGLWAFECIRRNLWDDSNNVHSFYFLCIMYAYIYIYYILEWVLSVTTTIVWNYRSNCTLHYSCVSVRVWVCKQASEVGPMTIAADVRQSSFDWIMAGKIDLDGVWQPMQRRSVCHHSHTDTALGPCTYPVCFDNIYQYNVK